MIARLIDRWRYRRFEKKRWLGTVETPMLAGDYFTKPFRKREVIVRGRRVTLEM